MSVTSGDNREAAALAEQLTNQPATNQQAEQTVPVHVVQAMREELKALKEKNEAFTNHLSMMQWQNSQQVQQAPHNPFGDADPEDSIKVKDAARLLNDFESRTNAQLAEIKMAARTPDYEEVIKKYLPKAAQEDPDLVAEIRRSPNPYKAAYLASKASTAYREDYVSKFRTPTNEVVKPVPKTEVDIEKVISNSKQSGNLSAVGNNASVTGKHAPYSQMTDDEFKAYKSKIRFKAAGNH